MDVGEPLIAERFEIVREIGRGGMGVVFEAMDRDTGRRVALKTLRALDPSLIFSLRREFRAMQGVRHPNLVRLGELFQDGSRWFFTMDLVDGRDLMTWLAPGSAASAHDSTPHLGGGAMDVGTPLRDPADPDRLRPALAQLAEALGALHHAGLIHGDVKPSNVLVAERGHLVLIDFGLVRWRGDEQLSGRFGGTPTYMAPEQAGGGPVAPAADCYAMGVIIYQALTGRLPFVGPAADVLAQKQAWAPVRPRALAPGAPADLEEVCLALLRPDPAARPSAEEVAEQLGISSRRLRVAVRPGPAAALVGRERELAQIEAVAGALDGRRAAVVRIHGESGIGKTALIAEAVRRLARAYPDALMLRGRCFEREAVAYGGMDDLVDSLVAALCRMRPDEVIRAAPRDLALLVRLFPSLGTVPALAEAPLLRQPAAGREARARAFAALGELLGRLALRRRLILAIDDAQWLTPESRSLLESLFGGAAPVPALLLISSRLPPLRGPGDWMAQLPCDAVDVALGPLDREESVALLRRCGCGGAEEDLQVMAADAAGHPLFLREVAHAGPSGLGARAVTRLDDVFLRRAERLPAQHREVLHLVCSSARPLGWPLLGTASGIPSAALARALEDLADGGLVTVAGRGSAARAQPTHDRVRVALADALPEGALRHLRGRLAQAMERLHPENAEALAVQWSEAGDVARAAGYARQAADRASSMLAFERAVELYELALKAPASAAVRSALLVAQGDAYAGLGRSTDAAAAYLRATESCGPARVDELIQRGATQLIRSGRVDQGLRLLQRVLERLEIDWPASQGGALLAVLGERIRLRLRRGSHRRHAAGAHQPLRLRRIDACWSMGDLLSTVDPMRGAAFHSRGLRLALDAGEPFRLARALCTEAGYLAMAGISARKAALRCLAQAEAVAASAPAPELEGWLSWGRGSVGLLTGDFAAAHRGFEVAEAIFETRCRGAAWEATSAREFTLWTLAYRGRILELGERLPRAVEAATLSGNRLALLNVLCGPSHVALLAADEPRRVTEACDSLSGDDHSFQRLCTLFARVQAALYEGRSGEALALVESEQGPIRRAHLMSCQFFRVDLLALRARAALAVAGAGPGPGPADGPVRIARDCARRLHAEQVPWAEALGAAIDAGLVALTGDRGAARAALLGAADRLAACGLALHAAAARWQAARLAPGRVAPDLEAAAASWFRRERVKRPEKLAPTVVPVTLRSTGCAGARQRG